MQQNKVLLTGSSGLLGSNLKDHLKKDFEITGVARNYVSGYVDQTIDITDYKSTKELFIKFKPEILIHSAAIASHSFCDEEPVLAKKVNLESTANLAIIAEEFGTKFIFISSDAVFKGDVGWYQESDEPNPFSYYGELKLLAEQAIAEITSNFIILRGSFFGQSLVKNKSIFEFFYNNILNDVPINGFTDVVSNSLDVINFSSIIKTLINIEAQGLFHYGSSDKYSKYELGLTIAKLANLNSSLIRPVKSIEIDNSYFEPRDLSLSTEKLSATTGIAAPTLEDCVKKVYEFFSK